MVESPGQQLTGKMGGCTKRLKKQAFFVLILVPLIYLVGFHFHNYNEDESVEPLPGTLHHQSLTFFPILFKLFTDQEDTKIILFWNSYYEDKYYSMGTGYEGFKNCQHSNCFTTTHRSSLMDPYVIVHAVVFHIPQLELKDVHWLKSNR